MYPIEIPITSPLPYPIITTFQSIPFTRSSSSLSFREVGEDGWGTVSSLHDLEIGNPHKPKFPPYESSLNVLNCGPRGIGPSNLFMERFKNWKFPLQSIFTKIFTKIKGCQRS
ncbi:hypothetical protein PanWU01x14_274730 [Parasponia andersonii]|uniref:Uncharacterized protein n=1 Tax=Parasponia andersonii TaxID=3476 RepID=A0A2P5B3B2_PARAD|nr:hypothetical protein PanWU01x14_274730 [Parasponia andersonii]